MDSSLIRSKLDKCGKLTDRELIDSLKPGQQGSLKVRPDGTIVDGNHRSRSFETAVSMWTPCRGKSFPKTRVRTCRKGRISREGDAVRTDLFWIDGPRHGRLAIMPRPRGGDWLEEEIQAWRRSGIDVVVSLLTPDEIAELNLVDEERLCRANGIEFLSFPITDRAVPASMETFSDLSTALAGRLADGRTIAVHCRQGIGRAGLVAVGLLIAFGMDQGAAIGRVGASRGCSVPETPDQRRWITDYAKSLVAPLTK
jgi:protein-tyrosine phosphatase